MLDSGLYHGIQIRAMEPILKPLVQNMIGLAINEAADEAGELLAPSSAAAAPNQQCTRRHYRTQIPLATLFDWTTAWIFIGKEPSRT